MSAKISKQDVYDFLTRFSEAIDRAYPDLPEWPVLHIEHIHRLLASVDKIPPELLESLTWVAIRFEPSYVGEAILSILSDICAAVFVVEDIVLMTDATNFFRETIDRVTGKTCTMFGCDLEPAKGALRKRNGRARDLMMRWFSASDPLLLLD